MKFKPGDLIERVAWGSKRDAPRSYRKLGAMGVVVLSSGKGTAVKVYWLDSQVTNIAWSHDLGKVSKAPPEKKPQS